MRFFQTAIFKIRKLGFFTICFLNFNFYLSQESSKNTQILTFVEGGSKSQILTLEESINSYDINHIETMIHSYHTKLKTLDTLNSNNTLWISRINYELVLLKKRRNHLINR